MNTDYKHGELTEQIIGAAYDVYNGLGHGFLEKVYENALAHEAAERGLQVARQVPIEVRYDGVVVGDYAADLMVNGKVIVEVKAVGELNGAHEAQLLNYLKATGLEVGLLLNFGPEFQIKRMVF
ncbi:MAG: GxxExxY protein [Candidatus Brocadiia bacterium]